MASGKLFLGADHAGFALKRELMARFAGEFPILELVDLGTHSTESVHYPEYAKRVADQVVAQAARGVLICGTGIGVAIAANKVAGIRAATVWDATSARLSRQHNDANILCLGARVLGPETAFEAARVWLTTGFEGGGRHQIRIDQITRLDSRVEKGGSK